MQAAGFHFFIAYPHVDEALRVMRSRPAVAWPQVSPHAHTEHWQQHHQLGPQHFVAIAGFALHAVENRPAIRSREQHTVQPTSLTDHHPYRVDPAAGRLF